MPTARQLRSAITPARPRSASRRCAAHSQQRGAELTDVISTRVLVASTRQAVTVLGCDDQLVEIEAVAALVD